MKKTFFSLLIGVSALNLNGQCNVHDFTDANGNAVYLTFDCPDMTFNLSGNYNGNTYTALASVKLANPFSNTIHKPFIFVEGLDLDITHHNNYRNGARGWPNFISGTASEIDPSEIIFQQLPILTNELHSEGYDIIYLDFYDGTTYMQGNAMTLVDLIQQLNTMMGPNSHEQIVVAGASMGGQIAKYALSYMEQHNMKHCVSDYISVDSPHKGAYLPISMLEMLDQLAPLSQTLQDYQNLLHSPAPEQLLVDFDNNGPHALRQDWLNDLNAVGNYPKHCRKVAISNGNKIGASLFPSYTQLAEFKVRSISVCNQGTFMDFKLNALAGYSNPIIYDGKSLKGSDWATRIANTLACSGGTYTPSCLLCIATPTNFFDIKTTNANTMFPSYDNAPGGKRNSILQFAEKMDQTITKMIQLHNNLPFSFSDYERHVYADYHCFIPTISGLDIYTSDLFYNVASNLPNPNISSPSQYPFDAYYAPSGPSEMHVEITGDLTTGNIKWTLDELAKQSARLTDPLTSTSPNNGVYNFARPENHYFSTCHIHDGGKLYVNANLPSDYGVNTPPPSIPNGFSPPLSGASLTIESCYCGDVFVSTYNNGEYIIGDNTTQNKGTVIFHTGSTFYLGAGGKLIIADHSKLVIESGAHLFFEQGAEIQLNGNDAVLEIQGDLTIGENAEFTFTHPGSSNGGYVKFSSPYPQQPPYYQISGQGNSSIKFVGQNKNTDKVLEVAQDLVQISQWNGISSFTIEHGMTEFTVPNSSISTDVGVRFFDSKFTGYSGNGTVYVWGQPQCQISHCIFKSVPLVGFLSVYGNKLTVSNCEMYDAMDGLVTLGMGVNLIGNNIHDNYDSGWQGSMMTSNSIAANSYFNSNGNYGSFLVGSPVEVFFDNCKMNVNGAWGLELNDLTDAKIHCGEVKDNMLYGIVTGSLSSLNMNTTKGGGYVNATNNSLGTILSSDAANIDLDRGYNDLQPSAAFDNPSVYSSLSCASFGNCPTVIEGTLAQPIGTVILANNNRWDPSLSSVTVGGFDKYTQVTDLSTTQLFHFADAAPNVRLACGYFDPPPCLTCPKSLLELCPTCNIIDTTDFYNTKTNDAVVTATGKMDTTIIDGHKQAVNMLYEILKYQLPDTSISDEYIQRIADRRIFVAYAEAIERNQILVSDSTVTPEVQKMVSLQNDKINKAIQRNDYFTKLYSYVEKALVLRAGEKLDDAVTTLDAIMSFVQPLEQDYVNYLRCVVGNERDIKKKLILEPEFIQAMNNCIPPRRMSEKRMTTHRNSETTGSVFTENNMKLYPNPTNNSFNIEYSIQDEANAFITVVDVTGKILYKKNLTGGKQKITVNDFNLENGLYFCSFYVNDKLQQREKLVIIK